MMEAQRDATRGGQRNSPPTLPVRKQDFLFVDAAKAKSSRQGRRNARSFVMQKARRERPWSTSKHAAKQRKSPESASPATVGTPDLSHTPITSTPSPPVVPGASEYFPVAVSGGFTLVKQETCSDCPLHCRPGQTLCPRCLICQQASTVAEDIDNSFDPFGTLSVEMNGKISELIDHFVTEMAPVAIAIDIRNKSDLMRSHWYGTAMNNAGFMHSLLCTAALHQYFTGRGSVETILHHRGLAIAAINSAISNPDLSVGISDANIGAVFNLLSVEETLRSPMFDHERPDDDQPNQREIHLSGLRRMVDLRGGLMAISSNRILQAFILWHTTTHAIASFEAPYLSVDDMPPRDWPNISNHLLDCCRTASVKESLTTLVESTVILISDLNEWFNNPNSPLDPLAIQNYACILECMVLKWLRENENVVNPLEDALCVALLIFTIRTTEALKRRADIHMLHFTASKRLEKALSATSRLEWQSCPDLLLWILAIGAISAEGSADSSWFIYQASLACSEFEITSAEALLGRLHHCGWVSFKLDEAVRHLWKNIIDIRLVPYSDETNVAGPLQFQVAELDFTDWQNIDLLGLGDQSQLPAEFEGDALEGDEGLYDFGTGVYPHDSPFYMR